MFFNNQINLMKNDKSNNIKTSNSKSHNNFTYNPKRKSSISEKIYLPENSLKKGLTNFLENYQDLLGMISGGGIKSSSMNSTSSSDFLENKQKSFKKNQNQENLKNNEKTNQKEEIGQKIIPKSKRSSENNNYYAKNFTKNEKKDKKQLPIQENLMKTINEENSLIKNEDSNYFNFSFSNKEEENESFQYKNSKGKTLPTAKKSGENLIKSFEKNYYEEVKITSGKINFKSEIDKLVSSVKKKNLGEIKEIDEKNQVQKLTNTEEIKDFYEYTEECLKRILKIKIPSDQEIEDLKINLPFEKELKNKKLAIFDLDETLIHCEAKKPSKAQRQIMCNLPNGGQTKIGVNIRPYWKECLKEISENYLVIVYTASHKSYADSVLDFLDPEKELIKYRLFRHNCVQVKIDSELIYVKDLRIFRNVKMENMIIIDNSVLSFAFHLENGIPILPYYEKEDFELKFLSNYLNSIYKVKDLRVENNRSIKMPYFLKSVKDKIEGKFVENNFYINTGYEDLGNKNIVYNKHFEIKLCSTKKNNSLNESSDSFSDVSYSEYNDKKVTRFECISEENSYENNDNSNIKVSSKTDLQEILHITLVDMRNTYSKNSQKKKI